MTEGLFILTTIFVAYVVHTIMGEQKATAKSQAPTAKPEVPEQLKPQVAVVTEKTTPIVTVVAKETVTPKVVATPAEPLKPTAAKVITATEEAAPKPKIAAKVATVTKEVPPKVAAKPTATKTATAAKSAATIKAATPAAKSAGLKDPKTGEVVTSYSNYRFIKRWIKEALVTEGLLEKIYTASELNAGTDAKIKEAIGKLEAMDKYKA